MFDADMNFRRSSLPDGRVSFSNTSPRRGEERVYATEKSASVNSGQGVARIVYRSNGAGGLVLLLRGVNMVTTEAAGEFVSNLTRLDEVLRLFGVQSAAELAFVEILLRTTAVDNSVRGASVIATRRLK